MRLFNAFVLLLCCFSLPVYGDDELVVFSIDPFDNFQKRSPIDDDSELRFSLNPFILPVTQYHDATNLGFEPEIRLEAFKGETLYEGLLLKSLAPAQRITVTFNFDAKSKFDQTNSDVNLVPSWFQAGASTTFSQEFKYLTHELLLKSDIDADFSDAWYLKGGKWLYSAPAILQQDFVETIIAENETRRLLLKINVPSTLDAGEYHFHLDISKSSDNSKIARIPIRITIHDIELAVRLKEKYSLFLYTMLALDPEVGRKNTYINGQNNHGSADLQKQVYRRHLKQIADKGFNGVIVTDWRPKYVEEVLPLLAEVGIPNIIIYGKSPVERGSKIVKAELVELLKSKGFRAIFYGYDEPGGNKRLDEQLAFNRKIRSLGGESINAIFWNDIQTTREAVKAQGGDFDFLTISMGSNGSKEFLNRLPLDTKPADVKYLAYWHPHVENPVRNKLFMGYWLWASGLDGVTPHAYYILPHVARYEATRIAKKRGRLSPFNDFAMWDGPNSLFRQHLSIYPHKGGAISTLQWEGMTDGVTDLILVNQLEMLLAEGGVISWRREVEDLLRKIRTAALVKNSSYFDSAKTKKYMLLMRAWRNEIKRLIVEFEHKASSGE